MAQVIGRAGGTPARKVVGSTVVGLRPVAGVPPIPGFKPVGSGAVKGVAPVAGLRPVGSATAPKKPGQPGFIGPVVPKAKPKPGQPGFVPLKPGQPGFIGPMANMPGAVAPNPALNGAPRYNCTLHPGSYPPPTALGGKQVYKTGSITPLISQNIPTESMYRQARWAYQFQFNPTNITFDTQLNPEQTPDAMFDKMELYSGQQVFQLELPLDRQMEVAGYDVEGRQHPDLPWVRKMGCLYDAEYLYRVVNGDPKPGRTNALGWPSSDVGYFFTTALVVDFGALRVKCYLNQMRVEHQLFAHGMVPIVSKMVLGFTRLAEEALPNSSTAPDTTTRSVSSPLPGGAAGPGRPVGAIGGPQA